MDDFTATLWAYINIQICEHPVDLCSIGLSPEAAALLESPSGFEPFELKVPARESRHRPWSLNWGSKRRNVGVALNGSALLEKVFTGVQFVDGEELQEQAA
jgi:hypothetical protein